MANEISPLTCHQCPPSFCFG